MLPDPSSAFANYPPSLRELAMRSLTRKPASTQTQSGPKDEAAYAQDAPPTANSRLISPPSPIHSYRRPTKEDLLRYARGFWTRLRIRFKWFTIRSFRRFNADDFSAFFTLGGLGTIVLIVIGTTTAFSIVLWGLEMLNMQRK